MIEVTVTILFFAQARELAKLNKTTAQLPQTLFGHNLRSILVDKFNLLSIGNRFILAVNENYILDSSQIILRENDIVAVIPPISGGNNSTHLFHSGYICYKKSLICIFRLNNDRYKNCEFRTRCLFCHKCSQLATVWCNINIYWNN